MLSDAFLGCGQYSHHAQPCPAIGKRPLTLPDTKEKMLDFTL
jgi:hypothetical protein